MKIIAKNEEEKQSILMLSRYLHDFRVYRSRFFGSTYITARNKPFVRSFTGKDSIYQIEVGKGEMVFLDIDDDIGNYIRHLYSTPELIELESDHEGKNTGE